MRVISDESYYSGLGRFGRLVSHAFAWGNEGHRTVADEGREHHGEICAKRPGWFEAGKIMPRLDHRHFTLETVCDAYRVIKTGPVAGKIVVDVDLLALTGE